MSLPNSMNALSPSASASVFASAGTGKTWMLVSRLLRLLLDGVTPDQILAITFTKKAAQEIQQRLYQRLVHWSQCEEHELRGELEQIGYEGEVGLSQVKNLYRDVLLFDYPVKVQTFHAFCADVLRQFPLEANIPSQFELLDDSSLLLSKTWDEFQKYLSFEAGALTIELYLHFLANCRGVFNARSALESFIHQQNDWYAFTQQDVVVPDDTITRIRKKLSYDDNFLGFIGEPAFVDALELLQMVWSQGNKTQQGKAVNLLLLDKTDENNFFQQLCHLLMTQNNKGFVTSKINKTLANKLGDDYERYLESYAYLCARINTALENIATKSAFELNQAWYVLGSLFLGQYKRLQRIDNALDYNDLEWKLVELLNTSDENVWIKYKLHYKLSHVLIDEFQDTNPSQWNFTRPILESLFELKENKASAFIVGDIKQSIYSFRRANPFLQMAASEWLDTKTNHEQYNLDMSRRSSQAIIDFANACFSTLDNNSLQWPEHSTVHDKQWGLVQLHPLCSLDKDDAKTEVDFRNPLDDGHLAKPSAYALEAKVIADSINALIKKPTIIDVDGKKRVATFSDIKLIMRQASHLPAYLSVFNENNIPTKISVKSFKVDNYLLSDITALLNFLDDESHLLALVTLLSSTIFEVSLPKVFSFIKQFNASDYQGSVLEALQMDNYFSSIYSVLKRWKKYIMSLPVHDALIAIFHESSIEEKYLTSSVMESTLVTLTLHQLLDISLGFNNGRYPNSYEFIEYLNKGFPGISANNSSNEDSVDILTVHSSKGLEAPIIIFADTGPQSEQNQSYKAIVNWPASHDEPEDFLLAGFNQKKVPYVASIHEKKQPYLDLEYLNLIYVAITRPRQVLIITGTTTTRNASKKNIHSFLKAAMKVLLAEEYCEDAVCNYEVNSEDVPSVPTQTKLPLEQSTAYELAPLISNLSHINNDQDTENNELASHTVPITKGLIVHKLIEWKIKQRPFSLQQLSRVIEFEADVVDIDELSQYAEASYKALVEKFFGARKVISEVPIVYKDKGKLVHGVIDALIYTNEGISIVDFKTKSINPTENLQEIAELYLPQLNGYKLGIQEMYPGKSVNAFILFTDNQEFIEVA